NAYGDTEEFNQVAVARFTATGGVDTSFGTGGTAIIGLEEVTVPLGVAVQSDGKIVIVGYSHPPRPVQSFVEVRVPLAAAVFRLTPSGALDTTFGTGGKVKDALLFDDESSVGAMAIQSGGKILVAGSINVYSRPCSGFFPCREFFLTRFSSSGNPDTT